MKSVRILGIDPGYDRLGIAIIENSEVIFSECFETTRTEKIHDRLLSLGKEVSAVIDKYKPKHLAIESLFITKNQKTAMRVSEARGIIIYEAMKAGLSVEEYAPMQIKSAITSDGSSDKKMMIKMINLLTKNSLKERAGKNLLKDDEFDAIAVALTHESLIHNRRILPK